VLSLDRFRESHSFRVKAQILVGQALPSRVGRCVFETVIRVSGGQGTNYEYQHREVVFREKYFLYEVITRSRGKPGWKSILVTRLESKVNIAAEGGAKSFEL